MKEVWRADGPVSVRDILEALNARSERKRAYTTIMTIMRRLARKGILASTREPRMWVYEPVVGEQEYLRLRADAEAGALVEEYGELALASFARQMQALDPERLKKLRKLAKRNHGA